MVNELIASRGGFGRIYVNTATDYEGGGVLKVLGQVCLYGVGSFVVESRWNSGPLEQFL